MKKRIVVTSFLIVFIFTALMYYAAIAHAQGPWTLTVVSAHDSPNPPVGEHTYNDNDSVTCNVTSPVTEGSTVWTCTGWTGNGSVPSSGSGPSTSFNITSDSSITWNWQGTPVQWTLTVSSTHGSPSPSAGNHTYSYGDSVTCNVTSPVVESGHSYTCTGWTGGGDVPSSGSGTSVGFTMSQNSSITWNWQLTQWTLTVASAHDSPSPSVGAHTYNDGDIATCSVSSPVFENGHSYTCTGWTGTGDFASGGSGTTAGPFNMTEDSSITWNWQLTQWTLTVASAHDSPSPGVGSHTYDDGSSVTCTVTSPVTEGSSMWTCTGWTGSGSVPSSGTGTSASFSIAENSSITWNWQVFNHTLIVSSGHDNPNPSNGPHTYSDGSSVTCSVTSPVTEGSIVWTCTGWTGSGSVPSSGSGSSTSFTMAHDSSITWNWQGALVQRTLTVYSAHDSPTPGVGSHVYADGSSVTCSVSSPVTEGSTIWTCTGWTGTGSVPSSGSGTTTSFAITADSSITWNWQGTAAQHTLTVSSDHDSSNPGNGQHVYSDGSYVTCNATSPVTEGSIVWTCTGWTGTGSVPPSGTGSSVSFTINLDSSITWLWQGVLLQRTLTVYSAHDSPNPTDGVHYIDDGSYVTVSGTGSSVSFTITQDSSITWNWHGNAPQHVLTVASAHGNPSPAVGNHPYDQGDNVTCSVTSPVTEGGVTYTCTGWSGTGSVPSTGSGTSVSFTISQDSNITWNWQVAQWTLTVTSAHGNPSPAVGNNLYNDGSSVTCSVSSPVVEADVSYTCTGWVGTGSVPPSGSTVSVTFSITENSSITWNWQITQQTLTVTSAHDNPNPPVGDHTYNDNDSVTCNVSSPVTEDGVYYTCTGWTGTGDVSPSGTDTSVTFTISQNSSITWNWAVTPPVQLTLTVTSAHDNPSPGVGDHLYDYGSSVTCSVSSPVVEGGISHTCTGWTGTGDVPPSGTDTSVTFTISQNSSITWNWQITQQTLTVTSAHDNPNPPVGDHTYNNGSSVTCTVTSPVTEAGQVWTCTGWVGTGSVPASGGGVSVTFSINEDSSITWNWQAHIAPTIESCDGASVQRDVFSLDETVYVVGSGFGASQTYNVYIVYDTAWFDGANITGRVQAGAASSDSSGNISLTAVWNKPLTTGVYDILVDVNGNGKYDAGVDALYSIKVIVAAGDFSRTEYLVGIVLGLAGCFAALGAFRMYKRRRH
ncbi:MAG: hypothetical protein ABR962_00140 [Candidatus Bathyarchaeia archaeon]